MNRFRACYPILTPLLLVFFLSGLLWWVFRYQNVRVDASDLFRYMDNGVSLLEKRHPLFALERYETFSKGIETHSLATYPNQLYSLTIASLSRVFSFVSGRNVVWPVIIPNVLAAMLGFCFVFLLFRQLLPPADVWLGMAVLGVHSLLMMCLSRPLSDGVGWCFAVGLFWFAICRPAAPWMLGVWLGVGMLFRMQLLVLLPFLIFLRFPGMTFRQSRRPFIAMAASAAGVLLLFEAAMKLYVRVPDGLAPVDSFGNGTYYVRDIVDFLRHYGSLGAAFTNFTSSLVTLAHPFLRESIGLALPLSLFIWARSRPEDDDQKRIRLLWIAALVWTLLPLLIFASAQNAKPLDRYQIVAIPLYVLTALYGLNRLSVKGFFPAAIKIILVAATLAGTIGFQRSQANRDADKIRRLDLLYSDFENLPQILESCDMPANGTYLVEHTLWVFLPQSRLIHLPARSVFRKGKWNHQLDGIILVNHPFKFLGQGFSSGEWLQDTQGVRFQCVYGVPGKSRLIIFKRVESPLAPKS
jgi:hypothetical protein